MNDFDYPLGYSITRVNANNIPEPVMFDEVINLLRAYTNAPDPDAPACDMSVDDMTGDEVLHWAYMFKLYTPANEFFKLHPELIAGYGDEGTVVRPMLMCEIRAAVEEFVADEAGDDRIKIALMDDADLIGYAKSCGILYDFAPIEDDTLVLGCRDTETRLWRLITMKEVREVYAKKYVKGPNNTTFYTLPDTVMINVVHVYRDFVYLPLAEEYIALQVEAATRKAVFKSPNAFVINPNSWHAWIARKFGSYNIATIVSEHDVNRGNMCAYVTAVLFGSLWLTCSTALAIVGIAIVIISTYAVGSWFGWVAAMLSTWSYITPEHAVKVISAVFGIALTALAISGIVSLHTKYQRRADNQKYENRDKPAPPPGFVKTAYSNFKDKTCIRLTTREELQND